MGKTQFSKILIIVLTVFNIGMIIWAFILYSCGVDVPEGVVIALISGITGEYGSYLLRAHFGKKNEEANKLTMTLAEMGTEEEEEE